MQPQPTRVNLSMPQKGQTFSALPVLPVLNTFIHVGRGQLPLGCGPWRRAECEKKRILSTLLKAAAHPISTVAALCGSRR